MSCRVHTATAVSVRHGGGGCVLLLLLLLLSVNNHYLTNIMHSVVNLH